MICTLLLMTNRNNDTIGITCHCGGAAFTLFLLGACFISNIFAYTASSFLLELEGRLIIDFSNDTILLIYLQGAQIVLDPYEHTSERSELDHGRIIYIARIHRYNSWRRRIRRFTFHHLLISNHAYKIGPLCLLYDSSILPDPKQTAYTPCLHQHIDRQVMHMSMNHLYV